MQRPNGRLLLGLLAAGVVSFITGIGFSQLIDFIPCRGEGLVCNMNEAVGASAVIIWAILGPVIFGLALSIARTRVSLAIAMGVLLLPLIAFLLVTETGQFRTFLATFVPPALTVLVQYLILRLVVPRARAQPQ